MNIQHLPIEQIVEAPWNPNSLDDEMQRRLRRSIDRFDLVTPLVVRPIGSVFYETIGGAQRLEVLKDMDVNMVPVVIVDVDDAEARLLSQALNRISGEDDLGLRAELVREILKDLPEVEVLDLLPESSDSLKALVSVGQEDMAKYLQNWQEAQEVRLRHLLFQLLPSQLEVVEEALARLIPEAKESGSDSPNMRGTALYLICKRILELEKASP